jgi:hypothetical protein
VQSAALAGQAAGELPGPVADRIATVWIVALVFAVELAVFLPISHHRVIDADEAFYLLAGRSVMNGRRLYADFLYPQTPLLPYLFGPVLRLVGESWTAGRSLAAAIAAGCGALLFVVATRSFGRRLALLAVALFTASALTIGWYPIVKTHGLATLCLLASWALCLSGSSSSRRPGPLVASGLMLGLAIDSRLLFVAAVPCLAAWVGKGGGSRKGALFWCLGLALGLVPCALSAVPDPAAFMFDNVGFHARRSGIGGIAGWGQKRDVVLALLGLSPPRHGEAVQNALNALALVAVPVVARFRPSALPLSFWLMAALALVSLLPTPTWAQYFAVLTPMASMNALWLWVRLRHHRFALPGFALLGLGFLAALPWEIDRYVRTGDDVPMVKLSEPRGNWQIARMESIAHRLDELIEPDEEVATWWPGYLIGSRAQVPAGFENFHSLILSFTPEERQRFQARSVDDLAARIATHRQRYVIAGNLVKKERVGPKLAQAGYAFVEQFEGTDAQLWRSMVER